MSNPQDSKNLTPPRLFGRWPIPFYYGWLVVAVVFLAEFTSSGMGGTTLGLFFKPMSESMGWSFTRLAGAATAQAIAAMAVAPIVGVLLDRFGARPVMSFGALIAGFGLLILAGIQDIWQFWILYAMVGALGLHELGGFTAPVVVAKWFVRRRGRAMALATSGIPAGGMVMTPIIAYLIVTVGWRTTWSLMGATLLLVILPLVFLLMRRQPEDLGLQPDGYAKGEPNSQKEGIPEAPWKDLEVQWTLRQAIHTRSLWLLILAQNCTSLSIGAVVIFTVPYFTMQEGMATVAASYVAMARLIGAFLSRFLWGFMVERLPVRLCLAFIIFARSLGDLSLVIVPFPYNIGTFVVFSGLLSGAFGLLQPLIFANYYGREFLGTIQGTLRPFLALPQLIGPLFMAMVFDATGSFDGAFLATAALALLVVPLVLIATPPEKPSLD